MITRISLFKESQLLENGKVTVQWNGKNIKLENLHLDYHSGQNVWLLKAYYNGNVVAYCNYTSIEKTVQISFIESLEKGQGYGKMLMLELAKMWGYENITRSYFTEDGAKLRKKIDKELDFDYDKWLESQNKHIELTEIDQVKIRPVKEFMKAVIHLGYDAYKNYDLVKACLEDPNFIALGLDINDVTDVTEWVKTSKTNNNLPEDEPPVWIIDVLNKLK